MKNLVLCCFILVGCDFGPGPEYEQRLKEAEKKEEKRVEKAIEQHNFKVKRLNNSYELVSVDGITYLTVRTSYGVAIVKHESNKAF